ncbi:geranyltranstransferase [Psychromonas sp. CNPT3]|uniref:(2E,6E)-farnesyl diphosphate synthase n=1 Tax=Psychromonas sp. CNPT3 TaxID=314282 RepID=UPI00006E5385|nr:(2E,6E)-farnesyl diphosphate synthase [Psychromonas sp. CNPT3]AGH81553.1 geranyltranstransferase [Psychromonas sp. CNPT3]
MTLLLKTLSQYQSRTDQQLTKYIDLQSPLCLSLNKAMYHGALLGGKRIRPFLVYVVGDMLGSQLSTLDPIACALECMHAYSLIHDDLPAMDDDALRRGQATCHIVFGEAQAILAGDALQSLAFDILSQENKELSCSAQLKMLNVLAKASGDKGMCAGQALDLAAENKRVDLTMLESIHRAKTGALIQAAVELATLTKVGLDSQHKQYLLTYARAIGLAFQVQDDILDITSDSQTLGKPQGSDINANKSTYPALLGLEQAQHKMQLLYEEAIDALNKLPYDTHILAQFALYIISRKN